MTAEISKKAYSKSNMEYTCKAMRFRVNAINVKYNRAVLNFFMRIEFSYLTKLYKRFN